MKKTETSSKSKARPAVFRALGRGAPPERIEILGRPYRHLETFKHDSWAATALYEGEDGKIVCKFNRRQSVFGFPMAWIGRRLARREAFFYSALADLPCVPRGYREVIADGILQPNAFAHDYVEGRPLSKSEFLPPSFFDDLGEQLAEMHRRGIAYMDLHKSENVLLGADDRPRLVDFQVAFHHRPTTRLLPLRWVFRFFKQADEYHLLKLRYSRFTPEERGPFLDHARPFWIRLHRLIAIPFRTFRRRLLVLLGIRRGKGYVQTERFVEHGLRPHEPESQRRHEEPDTPRSGASG